MTSRKQAGSVTVVLVIAACIIVMGALGWVYYQSSTKKNADTSATQTTTTTTEPSTTESTTTESTTTDSDFLVVTEWGIKLPLSTNNATAVYKVNSANRITLSTTAMTQKSQDCSVDGGAPIGGGIVRGMKDDTLPNSDTTFGSHGAAKQIGDYYYVYVNTQATCMDSDTDLQLAVSKAFRDSFAGVVAEQ